MRISDPITKQNAEQYDLHAEAWNQAMHTNVGHKYLEKPAMEEELPETLAGKSVLCIGVGSGEELEQIIKRQPEHTTAIDISNGLLDITKRKFPQVDCQNMDMMSMNFKDESFDYIYSSLTMHYAKDWDKLCSEVYRVLKHNGKLLFSTHNPDFWGRKPKTENSFTNKRGVTLTEHTAVLPGEIPITFYNHPNKESIDNALSHANFIAITGYTPKVIEIEPDKIPQQDREKYNQLKQKNQDTPLFLIFKASKA